MRVSKSDLRSVLLDATCLTGYSGTRGIGQVTSTLLEGLFATRDQWRERLSISVLQGISTFGGPVVTHDLAEAIAKNGPGPIGGNVPLLMGRRLRIPFAVSGFQLLHQMEAFGTPLFDRIPRSVTCYDFIPLRFPADYLSGPIELAKTRAEARWRFGRAARIVCISERTKRDLMELVRPEASRVDVVSLGLNGSRWFETADAAVDQALLAALPLPSGPFLLYVGGADRRKNAEGMMATLAELGRRGRAMPLVWAGFLEEKHQLAVRALAEQEGVADQLHLLGFVDKEQLTALFRRATAHLFLSRIEGFGLSVAEAMAVGCPVVVAAGSGAEEVAGDSALTVSPDDSQESASAVLRLMDDADLRTKLVARGRARIHDCRAERMALGYVESWEKALGADVQRSPGIRET